MGGIVGRLFREFAVVLSTAILVSLVVSLITTPMMCSRLLRHRRPDEHGKIYRASEKVFTKLLDAYKRSLTVVLRHPMITLMTLLLTIVLNIFLFVIVPKGFFPVVTILVKGLCRKCRVICLFISVARATSPFLL